MDILTLSGIYKTYNKHKALQNVYFSIPQGTITGLLGPNGAGKTTLLRIITRILLPDEGEILYKNENLNKYHQSKFGYLPEERGLYKKMKVREHLHFLATLKDVPMKEARKRTDDWLDRFEIADKAERRIEELSKGMQQKIQFIAALLHKPEIVILDEPFTGFDPMNEDLAQKIIRELNKDGVTFILSTHRMESVESYCSHAVFVNNGKIVLSGTVADIKQEFKENTYSIDCKGQLVQEGTTYQVTGKTDFQKNSRYLLKLKKGFTGNDLLTEALKQVEIIQFREELPGIEEIFKKIIRESE